MEEEPPLPMAPFDLHKAIQSGLTPHNIIRDILALNPEIAEELDDNKDLPLHVALGSADGGSIPSREFETARMEIVNLLLDVFPEGAMFRNKQGYYPLHFVVGPRSTGAAVGLRLLDIYPEAACISWKRGVLPIFEALKSKNSPELVERLLDIHPESTKCERKSTWYQDGCLPLHVALQANYEPSYIIDKLLDIYPESSKCSTELCDLPIHIAMRSDVPHGIIDRLLTMYPEGVRCVGNLGKLPIHSATDRRDPSISSIEQLLKIYPDAVKCPTEPYVFSDGFRSSFVDPAGDLPIHLACKKTCPSMPIVYLLLDLYPQSLLIPNKRDHSKFWRLRGSTPLECVNQFVEHEERNRIILAMCKRVCTRPCFQQGRYLLHEAIDHPLPHEIMESVLESAPYMVSRRDPKTKLYPFMQAALGATENSGVDMIYEMLRTDPSLLIPATRRKLVGVPTTKRSPKIDSKPRRNRRIRSLICNK